MAAQITAVIIFLIMFALIITEKIPRHIATTICSVATIILVFGVCMHSATALWDTLNFQTFTSVDFWRAGAEATESTKRNQLADHHFHRWYDDHGGRNGTFRIFFLALPDHCQSSQIQHDKNFYHVYDPCLCPVHVY